MEKRNNKNKKRLLILVALVGVMGIGGVVAATSISINGGSPLSLGAGYATATTCDEAVTVAAQQAYDSGANIYKITGFTVTNLDQSSTNPSTGIGCGATTKKVMQLAVVTSAGVYSASWTLASVAQVTSDAYVYTFNSTGSGAASGNTHYASVGIMDMKQIAIGISDK